VTATVTPTATSTATATPTPTIVIAAGTSNAPPSTPMSWLSVLAWIGFLLVLLWLLLLLARRRHVRPREPLLQPI
jgi:LPXTG-motif cell wall-anchored protein